MQHIFENEEALLAPEAPQTTDSPLDRPLLSSRADSTAAAEPEPVRDSVARSWGMFEESEGVFALKSLRGRYAQWPAVWGLPAAAEPGCLQATFEARAPEGLVIGLSPTQGVSDPMVEVVLGASRNTKSVVRNRSQGPERAVGTEPRPCTNSDFRPFWVLLKDGIVSCGVGHELDQRVIVAWRPSEKEAIAAARFVSFSSTCPLATIRSINVAVPAATTSGAVQWSGFASQPEYLQLFEAAREKNEARARRFQINYVEPDTRKLAFELPQADRERMRAQHRVGEDSGGFVTGFDPTAAEELAKASARAAKFGTKAMQVAARFASGASAELESGTVMETDEDQDEFKARDRREKRAERFKMPVVEDKELASAAAAAAAKLRVARIDPSENAIERPDAIHLYGPFDSLLTKHVLDWLADFGPSHVEWLHDCALNVVFADMFSARRAMRGLGTAVPEINAELEKGDEIMIGVDPELDTAKILAEKGWCQGTIACEDVHGMPTTRQVLMRMATSEDLKPSKPPSGSGIGWVRRGQKSRNGGRQGSGGGRRKKRGRDSNAMVIEFATGSGSGEAKKSKKQRRRRNGKNESGEGGGGGGNGGDVSMRMDSALGSSR